MKFNKVKEEFKKLKEENQRLEEIIRSLIMEKDEKEIIKKIERLRKLENG